MSLPWSPAECEQAHFHFSSPKEFAFWLIKASFFLATPGAHVTSQNLREPLPDGQLYAKSPSPWPSTGNQRGVSEGSQ